MPREITNIPYVINYPIGTLTYIQATTRRLKNNFQIWIPQGNYFELFLV